MKKDYPMIHQKPSVKLLRDIVNTVTGVDVRNSQGRQRHLVNAKMIYSKILMDKGFGCSQVGKSIRKHHTTILNYQRKWDGYVFSDDSLKGDYNIVCNMYEKLCEIEPDVDNEEEDNLNEDITFKSINLRELLNHSQKNKYDTEEEERLKDILELVRERTKKGTEEVVFNKLRNIYNGI